MPKLFIPINKYFSKVLKYRFDNSELLITKAIIALNNSTKPLAASNLKKPSKWFSYIIYHYRIKSLINEFMSAIIA